MYAAWFSQFSRRRRYFCELRSQSSPKLRGKLRHCCRNAHCPKNTWFRRFASEKWRRPSWLDCAMVLKALYRMRPEVQRLMNYTPPVDVYGRDRRAAVLIPLIVNPRSDELEVLLTVRSANLRRHSGEVALPGGRHETEDHDLLTTALREAQEEIGLPPQDVKSVTALPPFLSRFHLLVTPVVGTIPSTFTPKPNPDEVAACFTVPLRRFLLRQAHASLDITTEGVRWRKHRFWWNPLDPDIGKQESGVGYDIWGLTADILIRVALLAYDTPPEFEVDAPGQRDREEIIHGLNSKGRFGPRM